MKSIMLACVACLLCRVACGIEPDAISVKAYGAKGDGRTDDTAAIQAAASEANRLTQSLRPDNGSYLGSSPLLYFPSGRYVINDEIRLGSYANVGSTGRAIIEQRTQDKRLFVFADAYTVSIHGLRFVGGTNQIWLQNANTDSTMWDVTGCEFQVSSGAAIVTKSTSASDPHLSASLVVDRCKFIRPRQVLSNACDSAILRDCWVTIGLDNFDKDTAAIVNVSGVLMLDNLIGVPVFGSIDTTGKQTLDNRGVSGVRWVDNYGSLYADRCRFGGEFGGIPIVHHFSLPQTAYPFMGQTVAIERSTICAGPLSRTDSAAVTLRGGIPQLLRVVGNQYLVDGRLLRIDGPQVAAFLKVNPDARKRVQFEIDHNMTWPLATAIPADLVQFVR